MKKSFLPVIYQERTRSSSQADGISCGPGKVWVLFIFTTGRKYPSWYYQEIPFLLYPQNYSHIMRKIPPEWLIKRQLDKELSGIIVHMAMESESFQCKPVTAFKDMNIAMSLSLWTTEPLRLTSLVIYKDFLHFISPKSILSFSIPSPMKHALTS